MSTIVKPVTFMFVWKFFAFFLNVHFHVICNCFYLGMAGSLANDEKNPQRAS